jgi:hypothetical protein
LRWWNVTAPETSAVDEENRRKTRRSYRSLNFRRQQQFVTLCGARGFDRRFGSDALWYRGFPRLARYFGIRQRS